MLCEPPVIEAIILLNLAIDGLLREDRKLIEARQILCDAREKMSPVNVWKDVC